MLLLLRNELVPFGAGELEAQGDTLPTAVLGILVLIEDLHAHSEAYGQITWGLEFRLTYQAAGDTTTQATFEREVGLGLRANGVSTALLGFSKDAHLEMVAAGGTVSSEVVLALVMPLHLQAAGVAATLARGLRHPLPARISVGVLTPAMNVSAREAI